jgi:hypothetical protein
MKAVLEAWGRAFGLAFLATGLTYAAGILEAPNLADAVALGVAALGASIAGGLGAVKQLLPEFSWATILPDRVPPQWTSRLDVFTITAAGTWIVAVTDIINQAPDLSAWKAIVTSAVTGALAAGFRAVVGMTTKGEHPLPDKGLTPA